MAFSNFQPAAPVENYVWDDNTLTWVPMEQPVIEGPVTVSGTVTANLGTLNGAATAAKQDTGNTSLDSIDTKLDSLVGFDIPEHDYISLGYTGDNLTSVVYKTGGSGGTTVATLTLAYSGSTLTSVTKS